MARRSPARIAIQLVICGVLLFSCFANATHAAPPKAPALPPLQLPALQSTSFIQNFNPFSGSALPNRGTIYEPLYIVSYVNNSTETPWLATSYQWSKDLTTLTFTIRQGVKWSDGQPLTAHDVYYTIMLGKNPAFDMAGLWGAIGLSGVNLVGTNQVALHFKTVDVTRFPLVVDNLYILPEHIWAARKDPLHWANPTPVGSGPFTEVQNFQGQSYTLAKNPYYWNGAHVVVPALNFTQFATQDAITLALKAGTADWASAFIAKAETVFDASNPAYNHHYFSNRAVPIVLYVNTTRYPFSLPVFRQALSMAINRTALWKNAEYGYEPPATITGLSGLWPTWQDKSIPNTLAQYGPAAARNMLLRHGFTMKNGKLLDPKGHTISISLGVPAPWSDWVAIQQILAQNFQDIGIDANPKLEQFPQWVDDQNKGNFSVQISGAPYAATPYGLYDGMLGSEWLKPMGTPASSNFGRYSNPAFDALFARFRSTADVGQQHALVNKMQTLFVQQLPTIPLVVGALWEEFSTRHYTGFPSQQGYYADGRTLVAPDTLLVFTHLRPVS